MITLLPKQLECLRALSTDSAAEVVLFGGAAGGSKSFTGCAWQIQRRLKYAGTRGLIGRSKLDTLKKTTLKTFFEVASMYGLVADKHYVYNAQSNIITFQNKSEIILKDLFLYPSDGEFTSLGGYELTDAYVDEVAQVSKKAIDILRSRLRYKLREYKLQPKMLLTCNPSKGYLYNDFYAPWKSGALPEHYAFIQSLPTDNPYLPDSYHETLSRLPEMDRQRLLYGEWEYDESLDNLFRYDDILRCFRTEPRTGDMFLTADIARLGKDRTVLAVWQGLQCIEITELRKQRIDEIVRVIRDLMAKHQIRLNNVLADSDGIGGGLCDVLRCREFINGSRALQPDRFTNLKAQCYYRLAEYIEDGRIVLPIGHRDTIVKELDMIRRRRPEADGKLSVTGKEEIQRLHGISPDYSDALMMRMYYELIPNYGKYSIG